MSTLGAFGSLAVGVASISSITSGSLSSEIVVLVIVAAYLTFRAYRGMTGIRFRATRLFTTPMLYLILTLLSLFVLNPTYLDIIAVCAAVVVGTLVGLQLAGGAQFYEKNNAIYYKRSPLVLVVWLVSFVLRLGVGLLYPTNLLIGILVEILLAGTTGVIIGEAVHINRSYNSYKESHKPA